MQLLVIMFFLYIKSEHLPLLLNITIFKKIAKLTNSKKNAYMENKHNFIWIFTCQLKFLFLFFLQYL